jgi:cytoskeletal protein CcmA (bactofilin family)
MWKSRPDEKPVSPSTHPTHTQPVAPASGLSAPGPMKETRPLELPKTNDPFRTDVAAHIGKSVLIKGQLSGSEDLYLDGEVEGTIELREHSLVVGPNGRIHANISAREVVLHGKAEGNIQATERVELKKSCVLVGDITTQRILIEDGAFFKGSVDLHKESKPEPRKAMAAAATAASSSHASAPSAPVVSPQSSLLEHN